MEQMDYCKHFTYSRCSNKRPHSVLFLFPISSVPFIPVAWYLSTATNCLHSYHGNAIIALARWRVFLVRVLVPKKVYKHRSNVETNCVGRPYRLNILASEIKQSSAFRRRGAGIIILHRRV
ncbi:hypothetical protein LI328DRAFT_161365 [Trichoderma asperelloides]|nr:hypothetical protein LI328DRAFT_161365 [Trichoderma asperelloides]